MKKQNKFKIVIPSYNNEEWVEPNMASIINQTYTNYDVLYINDASTDLTKEKVNKIINEYNLNNWKVINNPVNKKRGYNIAPYNTNIIEFMENDEDILVFVDGDDWFFDENVLFKVNEFYNKLDPWMTYGGMYTYPEGQQANPQNSPYNDEVHSNNLYRKDLWRASHLRTFKWWLYKKIKDKHLRYSKTNEYYFHAEDLSTSYPCLEMCPKEKIGVFNFPTYTFNQTPNNRQRGIEREKMAGEELEREIRNQTPYQTLSVPFNSKQLFKWNRFDLPMKNLFLKFYDKNINCSFGEKIYKEHLRLWNNFKEYNNPNKNTYESFKNDFINIFKDIKSNNFNWDQSPIIIDKDKFLLNGSHRTAASSYLNSPAKFQMGYDGKDGQKVCDYNMFKQLNLDEKYLDASALELVKNNKDLLLVSLFPSAVNNRHLVDNILLKYSNIAYKKDIKLNSNGAFNYMLQLYKGEEWAGDWSNNFGGFRDKARLCFTNDNPMTVYLVEIDDLSIAKKIKEEIRQIYNIGNHSVHINDTYEETLRLSRCLFNKNSIHFLNNSKLKNYSKFLTQLNYFEQYIIQNNLDFDDYCVTASSVLSLYGLREGKDLDYLHFDPHIIQGHPDISSHNEYGVGKYTKEKDDIIFDPNNYFYYGNIKVASLEIVKALKEKRGEEKDYKDIKLIERINKPKILIYCGTNHGESFNNMVVNGDWDFCYGFEANPKLHQMLDSMWASHNHNINNSKVELFNKLLSNEHNTEKEFYIQDAFDAKKDYASSLGQVTNEYLTMSGNDVKTIETIKVKTINLVKFLEERNITEIDTLLTDLEGSDLTVLKTLKPLIDGKKIKNIQCEVEPDHKPTKYKGLNNKFKGFNQLLKNNYELVENSDTKYMIEQDWFSIDYKWKLK